MEISIDSFPSIKTKPPKVGCRLLNHASPQTPIGNAYFRSTIRPKISHLGRKSQVTQEPPHKLRAGANDLITSLAVTVPGNVPLSEPTVLHCTSLCKVK